MITLALTKENKKVKQEQQIIEFSNIINELINNQIVQKMKLYRQHYDISTFEHCYNVSLISYKICKKLGLDYISAARAGMLHDLFLYDWRNSRKLLHLDGYHAFVHPKIALENANKIFDLNKKEQDIIVKHMWPITISLPKYIESYVITFVDKYSTIKESFNFYNKFFLKKRIYRYAYIFLCLLILV